MTLAAACPIASTLADRIRESKNDLTYAWLERIAARVNIDRNRIFPTDALLDHVPLLVVGIADYIENPVDDIASDMPVVAKAMELGALRHSQGFDAYEILKEYELLGGVLFTFSERCLDTIDSACSRSELFTCAHRLFRAIELIQQVTTTHFLRMASETVREREERLRGFNRMVSHELKNRIGAIQGAHALLGEGWVDEVQRTKFIGMIGENAEAIRALLDNLVTLSRIDADARQSRHVELPQAAAEAVRQHRELARAQGIRVHLAEELPRIEVAAAAVELCLSNYISNAIKYSDPTKEDRWILIEGELVRREDTADGEPELVVRVRDNGLGLPVGSEKRLFQRFYRAHEETASTIEGTGLGLSIVRDTVESLGGRAWAERNEDGGSTFVFTLPGRRAADVEAEAGVNAKGGTRTPTSEDTGS